MIREGMVVLKMISILSPSLRNLKCLKVHYTLHIVLPLKTQQHLLLAIEEVWTQELRLRVRLNHKRSYIVPIVATIDECIWVVTVSLEMGFGLDTTTCLSSLRLCPKPVWWWQLHIVLSHFLSIVARLVLPRIEDKLLPLWSIVVVCHNHGSTCTEVVWRIVGLWSIAAKILLSCMVMLIQLVSMKDLGLVSLWTRWIVR